MPHFPKPYFREKRNTLYVQIRDQALALLVQRAQFEVKAKELGVDVSDEAVDKRIDEYIKERHKGNRKAFEAELKQQRRTHGRPGHEATPQDL